MKEKVQLDLLPFFFRLTQFLILVAIIVQVRTHKTAKNFIRRQWKRT
jgi:hypothetical protein